MINSLSLGQRGEAIAREYVSKFCTLLHTNWKSGRYEIDIIAQKNITLYFIEVKTRSSHRYGWPEEAVNYSKQEHIQTAAADYLYLLPLQPIAIRFDIIAITFRGETFELKHFRDVF